MASTLLTTLLGQDSRVLQLMGLYSVIQLLPNKATQLYGENAHGERKARAAPAPHLLGTCTHAAAGAPICVQAILWAPLETTWGRRSRGHGQDQGREWGTALPLLLTHRQGVGTTQSRPADLTF